MCTKDPGGFSSSEQLLGEVVPNRMNEERVNVNICQEMTPSPWFALLEMPKFATGFLSLPTNSRD